MVLRFKLTRISFMSTLLTQKLPSISDGQFSNIWITGKMQDIQLNMNFR